MKTILAVLVASSLSGCTGSMLGGGGGPGGNGPGDNPDGGTTVQPDAREYVIEDPVYGDDHPRIYLGRNRERLTAALAAGGSSVTRFRNLVDAQVGGGNAYDYQEWFGALMSQLTGNAAYCTHAVAAIDQFVASEEAIISGGGRPTVAADSYLEVGPKVGDVLLTYDWCFDATTNTQRSRWLNYAAQAVWNVWNHQDATWGGAAHPWSGWSVNNPSNNYYYSFLNATMLFGLAAHGEHPDADGWLTFFRDTKIYGELIPTFEADLEGGGSREGTGYGVAMKNLWHIYDFWLGSTGEDLSKATTHARASLLQMIHEIVPTRDRIAPIGDHARDATASLFDYHREYVLGLANLFRDDPLLPRAAWLVANSSVPQMGQSFNYVYDFLYGMPDLAMQPLEGLGRAYYSPGNGVLYARSGWDTHATWVNLIAGPYTESHAHRDQGSFMLFKDGWQAWDANVESSSGIRQEEALHNLVRITRGGETIRQREGTEATLVALSSGNGWLHAAADVTAVYDGNSAVSKVEREMVFLEPDCVVIYDRVTSAADTQQVWQLNTPTAPAISGSRGTVTNAGRTLRVERVLPESANSSVYNWASSDGEVNGGYRLDTTAAGGANQYLHVLWFDSAVGTVTRSDSDGQVGVSIGLAGGGTATVRFGSVAGSGSLSLDGQNVTLQPGMTYLPE